ncbi:MAG: hypothetical protein RLZZ427_1061 [Pseudomonadota bacterium]|jgi:MOSC domain-containing protein YiiM
MTSSTIRAVNLGTIAAFSPAEASAIAKTPVSHPVAIGPLGLHGDEQADRVHHGGPDKAIHHYPHDHYPFWRDQLGDHALLDREGAFGENISTLGLTETTVCLGDRFRLGSALVEISQGRQPCWKLDHRFDRPGVMAAVVRTARSGWYYRVIESGAACVGDTIELVERPLAEWSVARCFALLVGGAHKQDPAAVRTLADQPLLATPWRERAARLMG